MGTEHPVLREMWDFGDPEGSRKRFEELADTESVRSDPGFQAEVLTQIARAYGLQQQFDEADAVLDRVDAMLAASEPPRPATHHAEGSPTSTANTRATASEPPKSATHHAEGSPTSTANTRATASEPPRPATHHAEGSPTSTANTRATASEPPRPATHHAEGSPISTARVRSRLERGRVRNSSGHPADSVPLFTEALEYAQAAGLDDLAVDAAHMLGIVEPGDAAIAWNERALQMAEASADPAAQRWKGSLLNNLGWAYHDRGDHAGAREMFERCLAYHTENEQDELASIARWSIAKMDRHLGRTTEAVEIQRALLERPDHRDNAMEGYAREELAECLLLEGHAELARPEFARAYELLHTDPWLARDEAPRLQRLRELGGL